MLVSLTRLHLRSNRFLPTFFWHVWWSVRQAKSFPGFVGGRLARDSDGGFWTVTGWETEHAMRAYRIAGAHLRAMPKLLNWCDEASVAHWEEEGEELPNSPAVQERMKAVGRTSKVRRPSVAHAAEQTAPNSTPPRFVMTFRPK